MKNVHPVHSAGLWTHSLQYMNIIPWPLDQGSHFYKMIKWMLKNPKYFDTRNLQVSCKILLKNYFIERYAT